MTNARTRPGRFAGLLFLTISGVILLIAGSVFVLVGRSGKSAWVHNRQFTSTRWGSTYGLSAISRVTNYTIETTTHFPVRVPVSDSFTIELFAQIIDVSAIEYLADPKPGQPGVSVPIPLSAADKESWKDRAALSFHLDLPGMDFSQDQTLSTDGVARWAVRPKEKGIFVGYITPSANSGVKVDDTSPRTQIRVQVAGNYFTREALFAGLAYFFGSLLTLPGLWSFLREFKRGREEDKRNNRG
jgi:hypothetical protein